MGSLQRRADHSRRSCGSVSVLKSLFNVPLKGTRNARSSVLLAGKNNGRPQVPAPKPY